MFFKSISVFFFFIERIPMVHKSPNLNYYFTYVGESFAPPTVSPRRSSSASSCGRCRFRRFRRFRPHFLPAASSSSPSTRSPSGRVVAVIPSSRAAPPPRLLCSAAAEDAAGSWLPMMAAGRPRDRGWLQGFFFFCPRAKFG